MKGTVGQSIALLGVEKLGFGEGDLFVVN